MPAGRLDAGGCLRAGCLVAVVVGVVLGGLLLLAALASSNQRYAVEPVPWATSPAFVAAGSGPWHVGRELGRDLGDSRRAAVVPLPDAALGGRDPGPLG